MTAEITTTAILALVTVWNVSSGFSCVSRLHADYVKGIWIMDDELHTLQHFAITMVLMLLSIAMLVSSAIYTQLPWQFIEHMAFNLACVLMIYPHLRNKC